MDFKKLALEEFPTLSFCELIPKNPKTKIKNEKLLPDPVAKWIEWLVEQQDDFDLMRIRLQGGDLFFKYVGEERYLTLFTQEGNHALILDFLQSIESAATAKSNKKPKVKAASKKPAEKSKKSEKKTSSEIPSAISDYFFFDKPTGANGGSFIWRKRIEDHTYFGLANCKGRTKNGSVLEVCRHFLDSSVASASAGNVEEVVLSFYEALIQHNESADEYFQIKCEVGLCCVSAQRKTFEFVSTGIHGIAVDDDDNYDFWKVKRILKQNQVKKYISRYSAKPQNLKEIYLYTSGVVEQPDAKEETKLGHVKLSELIDRQQEFTADFFQAEMHYWIGDNIQYNDMSILGVRL